MFSNVETDVLVLGGGGAGARAALSAAEAGARVMVALKGTFGTSGATAYRVATIGGFQAATGATDPEDKPEEHFKDILRSAQGMCSSRLAEVVATEAPQMLEDLVSRGVELDLVDGKPVITTGCFASRPRMYWILGHGHSIVAVLKPALEKAGVGIHGGVIATSLLTAEGACTGAILMDREGRYTAVHAKATIVCTGGAARIFARNLFPAEITGDGYSLAFHAGARLANLEYIQTGFGIIHPITQLLASHLWRLVPELRNGAGEAFLSGYMPPGLSVEECISLRATHFPFSARGAERYIDIAAHTELLAGRGTERGGILFDYRGSVAQMAQRPESSRRQWEYLRQKLLKHGVDPAKEPLEASIFGHAFNGGIVIDESGESSVPGLYAAGEAAAGPHGADRLGGNMLMTSQVFGHRAGRAAARRAQSGKLPQVEQSAVSAEVGRLKGGLRPQGRGRLNDLVKRLQSETARVIVVRDHQSLSACLEKIAELESELDRAQISDARDLWYALELRNLFLVGRLVMSAALMRRESRGSHYRADFPASNDAAWGRSIVSRSIDGRIEQELAAL